MALNFYHSNQSGIRSSLQKALDSLSDFMSRDIGIISGYRTPAHNRVVGGAKQSEHIHRNAVDIDMTGWSISERISAIQHLVSQGIKGVITYSGSKKNMLHIDMRDLKTPHFMFDRTKNKMMAAPNWFRALANKIEFNSKQQYRTDFPEPPDLSSFPPAPSGPTGWPTPTEKGPGIYGARTPAEVAKLAEQYGLASTRYRQPVAATPLSSFIPTPTPTARPSNTIANMISGMDSPVYGPGQIAPASPSAGGLGGRIGTGAVAPASADPAASHFGGLPSMAGPDFGSVVGMPAAITSGTGLAGSNAPMISGGTSPMGSIFGAGTETPGMFGKTYSEARPDLTGVRTAQPQTIGGLFLGPDRPMDSGLQKAMAPAQSMAVPMEGFNPPSDMLAGTQMPYSPPEFDYAMAAVPAVAPAPVATAPAPATASAPVIGAKQTFGAPTIGVEQRTPSELAQTLGAPVIGSPTAPLAGFPSAPTAMQIANAKAMGPIQGMFSHPLASLGSGLLGGLLGGIPGALIGAALGNPFKGATLGNPLQGLGSLFGVTPTPTKSVYGYGTQAIGAILGGAGQQTPGATAYSRSTPGYSVTALGNGMVAKTNQYGHTSYQYTGPTTSLFGKDGVFSGRSGGGFFSSGKGPTQSEKSSFSSRPGLY